MEIEVGKIWKDIEGYEGKFIKEWKSATEAEKQLEINRKNISQCVTGKNKTAGGYKWVTKEQYEQNSFKL